MANWDIEGAVEQLRRETPIDPPTYTSPRLDLSELRDKSEEEKQRLIRQTKANTQWEMLMHAEGLRKFERWEAVERLNQYKKGERNIKCSTARVKNLVDELVQHYRKGMEFREEDFGFPDPDPEQEAIYLQKRNRLVGGRKSLDGKLLADQGEGGGGRGPLR